MKNASPTLLALLATRQFYSANLYTITLTTGAVLRYTDGDREIVSGGNTFDHGGTTGPYFNAGENKLQVSWRVGLETDTVSFDVMPGTGTVGGVPFLQALRAGMFDGADVQIEQAFMETYGNTSAGTVILFAGRMAECTASRGVATLNINSHTELLNQNFPRNLFQAGCTNSLYDTNCGILKATYSVTGTVASGSTISSLNATGLVAATGFFNLGAVVFTSGVNNGMARPVKAYTNGSPSTITLSNPFPKAPSAGDTFTIYPGCDKTKATCAAKFSNAANFRGFPYVPQSETAV